MCLAHTQHSTNVSYSYVHTPQDERMERFTQHTGGLAPHTISWLLKPELPSPQSVQARQHSCP